MDEITDMQKQSLLDVLKMGTRIKFHNSCSLNADLPDEYIEAYNRDENFLGFWYMSKGGVKSALVDTGSQVSKSTCKSN